jgi:hypothetical protein
VKSFDLFVAHMGEGQGQILTRNEDLIALRLHGFKELDRRERAERSDQHHCVPGFKLT